jgi:hypothetical protein
MKKEDGSQLVLASLITFVTVATNAESNVPCGSGTTQATVLGTNCKNCSVLQSYLRWMMLPTHSRPLSWRPIFIMDMLLKEYFYYSYFRNYLLCYTRLHINTLIVADGYLFFKLMGKKSLC